jgi:chromosome segregation ATPase
LAGRLEALNIRTDEVARAADQVKDDVKDELSRLRSAIDDVKRSVDDANVAATAVRGDLNELRSRVDSLAEKEGSSQ